MPFLNLRLTADVADQLVPDLPYVSRREYDEVRAFAFDQATGGGYVNAPITGLDTIQALILVSDVAITVRLNGQTDAGIPVAAGGMLSLVRTTIDNTGNDGVQIDNASGGAATIRGVAFGT